MAGLLGLVLMTAPLAAADDDFRTIFDGKRPRAG